MTWQLLRSIDAEIAEGTDAPEPETFPANQFDETRSQFYKEIELAFGRITLGGTLDEFDVPQAATSVVLGLWKRGASEESVKKVGTIEIKADTQPLPIKRTINGERLWVTVESFPDGTDPDLTVDVYARVVSR